MRNGKWLQRVPLRRQFFRANRPLSVRYLHRLLGEKLAAEDLMIELGKEVDRLRSESGPAMPTTSSEALRLEELHSELEGLRQTNKALIEQNEELQAIVLTRGVEEGRNLLNGTSNSLAQELGELNDRQVSTRTAHTFVVRPFQPVW